MTVLAAFVEGVSVTVQADAAAVAGTGAQVVEEKLSPATLDEKVTSPEGLDFVPAASVSATVAVTAVGFRTVTGSGAKVTVVAVARGLTARVTSGEVEAAWVVVATNDAVSV